jgi:hypothetical protein
METCRCADPSRTATVAEEEILVLCTHLYVLSGKFSCLDGGIARLSSTSLVDASTNFQFKKSKIKMMPCSCFPPSQEGMFITATSYEADLGIQ